MNRLFTFLFLFNFSGLLWSQASLPFTEDFELGVFTPNVWIVEPTVSGENGIVEVIFDAAYAGSGQFGARMGKTVDQASVFTLNQLGLRLRLAGKQDVMLDFLIRSFGEETHPEDGIFFSDNGGTSYVKVWDFTAADWCGGYGTHPSLNVSRLAATNGLSLTDDFVIQFRQFDNANFINNFGTTDADGFALDDIRVYESEVAYAPLPFTEDFEQGILSASWKTPEGTASAIPFTAAATPSVVSEVRQNDGFTGFFGLTIGKRCDQSTVFNVAVADLHLNLAGTNDPILTFWIRSYGEDTDARDGLYLSPDGGVTFTKIWGFEASDWCSEFGQHPPLNLRKLAEAAGVALTATSVLRFQQFDNANFDSNFGTTDADGFTIDDISVEELNRTYATLPFEETWEALSLGDHWAWSEATATRSFLSGTISPSASFGIGQQSGLDQGPGVFMGNRCDQGGKPRINSLDLYLNMLGHSSVYLDFWINDFGDESEPTDGLYLSDDGGASFAKIWNFDPSNWCNGFGWHPPVDLVALAEEQGLSINATMVLRFQQTGDANFDANFGTTDSDGFVLDNIRVYPLPRTYQELPFSEDFEDIRLAAGIGIPAARQNEEVGSMLTKPSSFYAILDGAGANASRGFQMGKRCDETTINNLTKLDISVNLDPLVYGEISFSFDLRDNQDDTHPQDAVLLSTDGGVTFTKIYQFDFEAIGNNYATYELDVSRAADSLGITLTGMSVLRIEQYDDADFDARFGTSDADGIQIDNVMVRADIRVSTDEPSLNALPFSIFPNPVGDVLTFSTPQAEPGRPLSYEIRDVNGRRLLSGLVSPLANTQLSVTGLKPGLYVFILMDRGASSSRKFVRQ